MKIELSDAELLEKLRNLCARERLAMADVLEHLAEVEERRLYREQAFSSLVGYCMEVLHFSEHQAWERVTAARALPRFPAALPMLREGALHLSGLALLAPHLGDHPELLEQARFQSKRKIEAIIAMLAPKPERPDRVRPVAPPKQKLEPIGPAQPAPFM